MAGVHRPLGSRAVTWIFSRLVTRMSPNAIVATVLHTCRELDPLIGSHPAHQIQLLRPIASVLFSAVGSTPSISHGTANPNLNSSSPLVALPSIACHSLNLVSGSPHIVPFLTRGVASLPVGSNRSFSSVNGAAAGAVSGGKGQHHRQEQRQQQRQEGQQRLEVQQRQGKTERQQQQQQQLMQQLPGKQQRQGEGEQGAGEREQRQGEGESHMVAVRGAFRQLAEPLQWSLRGSAFFVPTRVQEEGIPRLLKGESLFVSSPSGTGKTLAYLLPILHLLHLPTLSSSLFSPPHIPSSRLRQLHKRPQEGKRSAAANRSAPAGSGAAAATAAVAASGPFCLVLTPTLELANQVAEEVRRFTRFVPELTVDVVTAAASQQAASQVRSLHCRPPLVLVATPGRLLRLFREAASEKHPPLGPLIPTRTTVAPEGVTTETALPESGSSGGQPVSSGDAPSSSIKAEEWTESESAAGKTTAPDLAGGSELNVGIDNGKRKTQGLVPSCLPKDFLGQVRHWVVEECDKMAEMGLLEDLRKVFSLLPRPQRAKAGKKKDLRPHMQVILVSATILPESELLLRRFAPRGDMLIVQPSSSDKPLVKQLAYCVTPRRKTALLLYLLRRRASLKNHQVLVFVRTVHRVERLHQTLCEGGITAVRLHGELTGPVRSQSLEMFRQGNAQVLVSTNVAARGVDIPNLPFVVNFDPPGSPQEYLHRIGRTGRAGASGTAISFLEPLNEESSIGKRALATESQLGGRVQEESSQKADMPDWMAAAQELLGQRIEFRKVPGPWRDDPDDIEDSVIPSSARGPIFESAQKSPSARRSILESAQLTPSPRRPLTRQDFSRKN